MMESVARAEARKRSRPALCIAVDHCLDTGISADDVRKLVEYAINTNRKRTNLVDGGRGR